MAEDVSGGEMMRFCPECGRRLRHRLGSRRWYCPDCRRYFYRRGK